VVIVAGQPNIPALVAYDRDLKGRDFAS
jgi:hypothetical protein